VPGRGFENVCRHDVFQGLRWDFAMDLR
jgi:hypothetical protein